MTQLINTDDTAEGTKKAAPISGIQYPNGNFVYDRDAGSKDKMSFQHRVLSLFLGAAAIGAGMALLPIRKTKSAWGLLSAGAGMILRGATGRCWILKSLGLNCQTHQGNLRQSEYFSGKSYSFESEIKVNQSADKVFQFISNVRNLSSVIPGVNSISKLSNSQSRWNLKDGKQFTVSVNSQPTKRLFSWKGLKKGLPRAIGTVRVENFDPNAANKAAVTQSIIHINIAYKLPAMPIKHWWYLISQKGPELLAAKSLKQLKLQLEA